MSFYHPEASGATTLTQTGSFCPLTNALPEITNCSDIDPTIDPNPPAGPIATYQGLNGSSTNSLNQLGLTYEIHKVLDDTGTDITSTQTVFTIADVTVLGNIVGQLSHDETQARGNSYTVEVRVYDYEGVEPNSSGICSKLYVFPNLESVFYNGATSITCNNFNNPGDPNPLQTTGTLTVSGTSFDFGVDLTLTAVTGSQTNQNGIATISIGTTNFPSPVDTESVSFAIPITTTASPQTVSLPAGDRITRAPGTYYYSIEIANDPTTGGDFFNNTDATATITHH